MDLKDFSFGKGILSRLAGNPPAEKKVDVDYKTNTVDIGKMAEDSARSQGRGDKSASSGAPYPKTPSSLASPMTPQSRNSKGK